MSTLKALFKDVPVEWKALSLFSTIGTGNSNRQDESENGEYPFYVRSKKILKSNTFQFDEIAIVIPGEGGIGEIFHYVEGKYALHQRAYRIKVENENISTKFLYYFMMENFKVYISSKIVGATATSIRKPMLEGFLFPIPYPNDPEKSLVLQQEIVRVLDGLSEQNIALTTALAQEIDQRKKQYAYYREELFRFEGKEVAWKTFGDLGEIIRGNGLQKSDFTESGVGCIHYGQIYTYYGTSTDKTKSFVSLELAKKLKKVNQGDLIITNTSENIEDVCKAVAWLGENEIVTGGHACILKHSENPKYIAYYTQCAEFFKDKKKVAKGTKVMDVSAKDLAKIKIPVPFLQEQERIVRLLDQFDEATKNIVAQLEKEIELRNKQYEYYRNELLGFSR